MLLITGAGGQLGRSLVRQCRAQGLAFQAFTRQELDITDANAVERLVRGAAFDCIVNCAAYTAVDEAEDNPARAYAVNAYAPWLLARTGLALIHISTDYVFDGLARRPYQTNDPARPVSVYGLSKRAAETALLEGRFSGLILRTAWLYSKAPGSRNFYQTIRRLALEQPSLTVVDDQIGAPTRVDDLAEAVLTLYARGAHRLPMQLMHFTNTGQCSRWEFACSIAELAQSTCRIEPISTEQYVCRAARPSYSVLALSSLAPWGIVPRHWRQALKDDSD